MPHSVPAAHRLPLAVALALGIGGLPLALGAAPGAVAAPPPQGVLSGSVDAAIHGEALRLSGRVPARSARPVALQRRTPQRWLAIDSARTDAEGRFAFDRRTRATSTTYRVVAERTRRGQDRAVTPRFRMATLPQSADLQTPATVDRDGTATAAATLTPARAGRVVRLERAVGDGWTRVDRRPQSATGEVAFALPTAAEGVETYRVVGRAWEGAPRVTSAASTLTVADPRDTTPPAVPTDLTATPGDGSAGLTWTGVADDDLAGYRVHTAAPGSSSWTEVTDAPVPDAAFTLAGLANDVPVLVAVTAVDTSGNESARSTPVTVTPADTVAPATPQDLLVTTEPGTREATVSWSAVDDAGLAGYRVHRAPTSTGPWTEVTQEPVATTSYVVTGLVFGHVTHLRVSAEDDAGNVSGPGAAGTVTPQRAMRAAGEDPWSTGMTDYDHSDDGRFVTYSSASSTLVEGDTNNVADVFLLDRSTGTTELVSRGIGGLPATNVSLYPSISGDGQRVAFVSRATNLVAGGLASGGVYLWHRATGEIELVSRTPAGLPATGFYYGPSLDDAGQRVAFRSSSTQLTPADTDPYYDVFVWDRAAAVTTRVSTSAAGGRPSTGVPYAVASRISGDGRHVAWVSAATDVVAGDANNVVDVFVWDADTGTNTLASRTPQGSAGNGASQDVSISDDGDRVAFSSQATDLVAGTPSFSRNVFLWERGAGVRLVAGGLAPFLSGDGSTIATLGQANNARLFVMVRTLSSEVLELSERATTTGQQADQNSYQPLLDDDGSQALFLTMASNLVAGDTDGAADLVTWGSR